MDDGKCIESLKIWNRYSGLTLIRALNSENINLILTLTNPKGESRFFGKLSDWLDENPRDSNWKPTQDIHDHIMGFKATVYDLVETFVEIDYNDRRYPNNARLGCQAPECINAKKRHEYVSGLLDSCVFPEATKPILRISVDDAEFEIKERFEEGYGKFDEILNIFFEHPEMFKWPYELEPEKRIYANI
jgi:hypothetical protein